MRGKEGKEGGRREKGRRDEVISKQLICIAQKFTMLTFVSTGCCTHHIITRVCSMYMNSHF